MKIEMGKTYLDRSGEKVRIVCVDSDNGRYPIIGLFGVDGNSWAHEYAPDGRFYHPDDESGENRRDLISEYTPPAPLLEIWVVVATRSDGKIEVIGDYESKDAAEDQVRTEMEDPWEGSTYRAVFVREVRDDHA
jgi:hypothetical protein